jgi:hypothetical protein
MHGQSRIETDHFYFRGMRSYSGIPSAWIVAFNGQHIRAFGWCDVVDTFSDCVPEGVLSPCRRLAQQGHQFGKGILDRIEVAPVRRNVKYDRASDLDQGLDPGALVAGQVVHHDGSPGFSSSASTFSTHNLNMPRFTEQPITKGATMPVVRRPTVKVVVTKTASTKSQP